MVIGCRAFGDQYRVADLFLDEPGTYMVETAFKPVDNEKHNKMSLYLRMKNTMATSRLFLKKFGENEIFYKHGD